MASLQTLALYLAAGIEVEHPLHGRGLLHGLPSHHIGEGGGQLASVRFDRPGSPFPDWYLLKEVTPVLYAPYDYMQVLNSQSEPQEWLSLAFGKHGRNELEKMARIVDAARALGIALNLSLTDYIRKELTV